MAKLFEVREGVQTKLDAEGKVSGQKVLNDGQRLTAEEQNILKGLATSNRLQSKEQDGYDRDMVEDQLKHYFFDMDKLATSESRTIDRDKDPIYGYYKDAAKNHNQIVKTPQEMITTAFTDTAQAQVTTKRREQQYAGTDEQLVLGGEEYARVDGKENGEMKNDLEKLQASIIKDSENVPVEEMIGPENDVQEIAQAIEKGGLDDIYMPSAAHQFEQREGEGNLQYRDRVSMEYKQMYNEQVGVGKNVVSLNTMTELEQYTSQGPAIVFMSRGGADTVCTGCKQYGRYFLEYSKQPEYEHIQFITLDVDNPSFDIYEQQYSGAGLPQIVPYANGVVADVFDRMKTGVFASESTFIQEYPELLDTISISERTV